MEGAERSSRNRRLAVALAGIAAAAVVLSQIVIPPAASRAIEERLTEDGGTARVEASAFPALRLLLGSGSRLEIEGEDLVLPLGDEDPDGVFGRLDEFGTVDIALTDVRVGPLALDSLALLRPGSEDYLFTAHGTTDARSLAIFGASRLDVPGAGLLGFIPGDAGEEPIELDLDMELRSDEGRIVVTEGGGEVAGVDTGPLAALITSAIVVRL
ncbi:hypothetical protein HJD18_06010 [Thermoleophilia bacterium SCSIO 60948]|nr:hypothetical protein HJD18_06010 [Thermoleophilia bacterium SCSIO 60948]